jgi:hypothetical protein
MTANGPKASGLSLANIAIAFARRMKGPQVFVLIIAHPAKPKQDANGFTKLSHVVSFFIWLAVRSHPVSAVL